LRVAVCAYTRIEPKEITDFFHYDGVCNCNFRYPSSYFTNLKKTITSLQFSTLPLANFLRSGKLTQVSLILSDYLLEIERPTYLVFPPHLRYLRSGRLTQVILILSDYLLEIERPGYLVFTWLPGFYLVFSPHLRDRSLRNYYTMYTVFFFIRTL